MQEIAKGLGMSLTKADAESYHTLMQPNLDAYDVVDAEPDPTPSVTYRRTTGYAPEAAESPYGAWAHKAEAKGTAERKLKGNTVAPKVKAAYDLLLMPTLPITASKLPEPGAPIKEVIARAFEMIANTSQFDVTGHPSMSIPVVRSTGFL